MFSTRLLNIYARLLLCGMCICMAGCKQENTFSWVNPPTQNMAGLQHHIITSQYEKEKTGLSILLPPGYNEKTNTRYRVIYYLHGWGGNESSEVISIQNFVTKALTRSEDMPIIVYPNGGRSGYFGPTENMIIKELIPYIEENFRVLKSREDRTLLGFSMGGTAALRLTLKYPQLFSGAVSLGGRLWPEDKSLVAAITMNSQIIKTLTTQLLLIQGEQDNPNQFQAVTEKLVDLDIPFKMELLKDTDHKLQRYLEKSTSFYTQFKAGSIPSP